MCRSAEEGGHRCVDVRHLRRLTVDDLLPEKEHDRPDLDWPTDSPNEVIERYGKAGVQAVSTLLYVKSVEGEMTSQFLTSLPDGTTADGLQWRIKSPSSLARKIADRVRVKGIAADDAAAMVQDIVRYTAVSAGGDRLAVTARDVVDSLGGARWRVVEAEQSYVDANGRTQRHPYKGLHLIMRSAGDVTCEVQVHSPESMVAKGQGHLEYEVERDSTAPREVRAAARKVMEDIWAQVPTPAGLDRLSQLGGVPLRAKTYPNPYRADGRRTGQGGAA